MPSTPLNKKALTLSIIIPVYNEENYIGDCLDAIAGQTVVPDEVIVVDNNSIDKTAAIAASFPFVRIINEPHQGIVYARNTGFEAAKSDLIGRIDADTQIHKKWVENVLKLADDMEDNHAFTGPASFRDWRGKMLLYWGHRIIFFWSSYLFLGHHTLFGSNMFLKKSLWQQQRQLVCLRNDIHEDMDLSIHIRRSGGRIKFEKKLKVTISPRRIFRMGHYPLMWFKTHWVHLVIPKIYG